jgi:paraquat-inducible protein A
VDTIIALCITGLVLLAIALPFEFLGFESAGQQQVIKIPDSIAVFLTPDYWLLAALQAFFIILLPAYTLGALLYLLIPHRFNRRVRYRRQLLNWVFILLPWSMAEIFIIGVIVSLVKITSMADVYLGPSFFAFSAFGLIMALLVWCLDEHQLRTELDVRIAYPSSTDDAQRKSIHRTWAYLLSAVIFYIPASIAPIMSTEILGRAEPSTIMGGVLLLWSAGSYPIAAVIFIASVFVPIAKLLILAWLNYSVSAQHSYHRKPRATLYLVTEIIGRWSMVDVFVVAILVSLVQLGNIIAIVPGPAALAFSAVVISTMLAASSFDQRLIWRPGNE